ncbi:heavy-metal-associated domain-containing protein [Maritimibacter dapengensis]|uniref:Heavy-metal-associated domain-containing protein n=1 Tax=Maritimibacter dapengensis TaxID=2836868 RepID=A0ABS6T7A6_9RHOB|nr:heavy metal-associated domain-containing protein [Maritimibacter dapengensis]MBV7380222.1 heavy-metal-associated domain-containing protein [Maritimibacter dapengensis]
MTRFSVPDMSCGHCKAKIEDAVLDADEGAVMEFDFEKREVEVDSTLDPVALEAAIKGAGFSPRAA